MNTFSQSHAGAKQENGGDSTFFAARSSEIAHQAEERLGAVAEVIKTVVSNRPMVALGAALAAGVFLGWLIKRR